MTTKSYIVIKDKAQELTNKTIDADSNVISNIDTANFKDHDASEYGKCFGAGSDGKVTLLANVGDYLQTAGGTMMGDINLNANIAKIVNTLDTNYTEIGGGTVDESDAVNGAYLRLSGKSRPNGGCWRLVARNDDRTQSILECTPSGYLELDAKRILDKGMIDYETLDFNDDNDLHVKDYSLSLTKLAKHTETGDTGKILGIAEDGSVELKDNPDTSFLPLAGGTMTGVIKSSTDSGLLVDRDDNDKGILICGGTVEGESGALTVNGGTLSLTGSEYPSVGSAFGLTAGAHSLMGTHNGDLKWDNKNLKVEGEILEITTDESGTRDGLFSLVGGDRTNILVNDFTFTAEESPTGASEGEWAVLVNYVNASNGDIIAIMTHPTNKIFISNYVDAVWGDWSSVPIGNYLPLAGGTMTGAITSTADIHLKHSDTAGSSIMYGGTAWNDGSWLALRGGTKTDSEGQFELVAASSSTAQKKLLGKPDGTLTWDSNNVITAAGGTMTGDLTISKAVPVLYLNTTASDYGSIRFTDKDGAIQACHKAYASSDYTIGRKATNGSAWYNGPSVSLYPDGSLTLKSTNASGSSQGTITLNASGNTVFNKDDNTIVMGDNAKIMKVCGGTATNNGAYLAMIGKDYSSSSYKGVFYLSAGTGSTEGTNRFSLVGNPSGDLKWSGKSVQTSGTMKVKYHTVDVAVGSVYTAITAHPDSGYQFLSWTGSATDGCVMPTYLENYGSATTNVWLANNTTQSFVVHVNCYFIEVKT